MADIEFDAMRVESAFAAGICRPAGVIIILPSF